MLWQKAFTAFGFRVAIVLCDGASSNLILLKILCGCPRATLPIDDHAETLRGRYFVNMSFTNTEDPFGSPIFAMICPSHQVFTFLLLKQAWKGCVLHAFILRYYSYLHEQFLIFCCLF